MFDDLREDLRRCRKREILLNPSTWAIISYRFRRAVAKSRAPAVVKWPAYAAAVFTDIISRVASHVELPTSAEIGRGLCMPHAGYVVVAADARIGRHCTIGPGVTIGHARGGGSDREGSPVIGDRVYIGPGAAVIGPIEIGSDALIGAGAVVVRSVPPAGVVAGNPAQLISREGSFNLISYRDMDKDRERIAALANSRATDEPERDKRRLSASSQPGG
jgi:serine O-acetyltransferase